MLPKIAALFGKLKEHSLTTAYIMLSMVFLAGYLVLSDERTSIHTNLISEILSILVTVLLIDRLQRQREEQRWSGFDKKLSISLFTRLASSVDWFVAKRYGLEDEHTAATAKMNLIGRKKYWQRTKWMIEHGISKALSTALQNFNIADVEYTARISKEIRDEAGRCLGIFAHRTDPKTQEILIEIHEAADHLYWIHTRYISNKDDSNIENLPKFDHAYKRLLVH